MAQSIHDFHDDPRNAGIRIWINGALRPRAEATVSVFDSGFVLGDGVWEGFRVLGGHPLFLDAHLDRLYAVSYTHLDVYKRQGRRPSGYAPDRPCPAADDDKQAVPARQRTRPG